MGWGDTLCYKHNAPNGAKKQNPLRYTLRTERAINRTRGVNLAIFRGNFGSKGLHMPPLQGLDLFSPHAAIDIPSSMGLKRFLSLQDFRVESGSVANRTYRVWVLGGFLLKLTPMNVR